MRQTPHCKPLSLVVPPPPLFGFHIQWLLWPLKALYRTERLDSPASGDLFVPTPVSLSDAGPGPLFREPLSRIWWHRRHVTLYILCSLCERVWTKMWITDWTMGNLIKQQPVSPNCCAGAHFRLLFSSALCTLFTTIVRYSIFGASFTRNHDNNLIYKVSP